jgi:hypothetical protein
MAKLKENFCFSHYFPFEKEKNIYPIGKLLDIITTKSNIIMKNMIQSWP